MMLDIAAAREGFRDKTISDIGFVRSSYIIADGLTKAMSRSALQKVFVRGRLTLSPEKWIIRKLHVTLITFFTSLSVRITICFASVIRNGIVDAPPHIFRVCTARLDIPHSYPKSTFKWHLDRCNRSLLCLAQCALSKPLS